MREVAGRFFVILSITIVLSGAAVRAEETAVSGVKDLLAAAMRLTAEKKLPEALTEYEAIAVVSPHEGLPALARFIALTGTDSERAAFIARLDANAAGWDDITLAKAYDAAGAPGKAEKILSENARVLKGDPPAATMLLAKIIRNSGDDTRADEVLADALTGAADTASQAQLFRALVGDEKITLRDDPKHFAEVIDVGVRSLGTDNDSLTRVIDPAIINLMRDNGTYFRLRDGLLKEELDKRPGAAFFSARMILREEKPAEALALLEAAEKNARDDTFWPALAQAKADILRSMGKNQDARALYDLIAEKSSGAANANVVRENARLAIATGDPESAIKQLAELKIEEMPFDEREQTYLIYTMAASAKGDIPLIIDLYARASRGASPDQLAVFQKTIFTKVLETDQHVQMEENIRKRFSDDPKTPAKLWLLAAAAAVEARRLPNQVEALYEFAKASPNDPAARQALADVVTPLVENILKAPPDAVTASKEEIAKISSLAEQSLVQLVKSQPLDPNSYAELISLYKAQSLPDVPEKVMSIVAISSSDPRVKGVCAYALSTNGFPEQALPLYDEALKIDPANMQIRMNRASCLTRIGRSTEAREFYSRLLTEGDHAMRFHVHEIVARIWAIDQEAKREDEGVKYFENVIRKFADEWRNEATNDIANIFAKYGKDDNAEALFLKLTEPTVASVIRIHAYESLAELLTKQKKFGEAEQIFAKAEKSFAGDEETLVGMTQARAQMMAEAGKLDEAVALLRALSTEHPKSPLALNGLYLAAKLSEKARKPELAARLYGEFLKTNSTDFSLRATAQEKLTPTQTTKGDAHTP